MRNYFIGSKIHGQGRRPCFNLWQKSLLLFIWMNQAIARFIQKKNIRQILNFLLQNIVLDGKKLSFTLKTPFNRVLEATTSDTKLRR